MKDFVYYNDSLSLYHALIVGCVPIPVSEGPKYSVWKRPHGVGRTLVG